MPVAIVTGASAGIGRAIAGRLGSEGMAVVVNYLGNRTAAEELVTTIEACGGRAVAARADVSDPAQLRGLFDLAEDEFGGVDILVNNAGTARFAALAQATDEDFDLTFSLNVKATFVALREAANRLRDHGRIVVISSGVTVTHRPGSAVYAASKAAAEELVRVLAKELGPRGITVNSVLPGATRTEALAGARSTAALEEVAAATPLGRIGEPGDIADIVAFLVSGNARWITGQSVRAGGGLF
ncbi:3-oxoacyl-[acyl-carrier-protein] reductase FabG [Nocardia cerradoensis]|uniref:3-oxoacyl-[acyl-carrier-protein] reductase FabG n=1 Tax=Nocardia cerradoensis TaxID=85688 RepID=A0A231GWF1_9NOCA|nr:SDR family oxidoreductase [Nocardia cerradoensis]OXR40895.1 3-oxoacyl-[acyl-carrier-protein] reductase FabG [Nocardia cerradoensis]